MKTNPWKTILGIMITSAGTALAAPGTISASLSNPTPDPGSGPFTITFSISGYTDATQIDGFNFRVVLPGFLSFSGSGTANDGAAFGASQNWLRLATQNSVPAGSFLTDNTAAAGSIVDISVADLRPVDPGDPSTLGGTVADSGFLYSFEVMCTMPGTGTLDLSPALDGTVLYDEQGMAVSGMSPVLSDLTITCVPEPGTWVLVAAGAVVLLACRRLRLMSAKARAALRLTSFRRRIVGRRSRGTIVCNRPRVWNPRQSRLGSRYLDCGHAATHNLCVHTLKLSGSSR